MSFESFNSGYFETRSPENIELGRQQRINLNKEWYAAGNDTNRKQEYAVHYGRLQGVETIPGDNMYYINGGAFHMDYYIRAAKRLGLTINQAIQASQAGSNAGSGRPRDDMVRKFRDQNLGTNEQQQYLQHRELAKSVTANSYARMSSDERSYYDQMPEAVTFAREQIKAIDPTYTALDPPEAVTISINQITENSASVNWSPNSQGGSSITGYHYVLVNKSTGQTIKEYDFSLNQRNSLEQNLVQGNNYTAYVIAKSQNGNSLEASKSFRTLGINLIEEEKRLSEEARVARELERELQAIQQKKIIDESASLGFNLDGTAYPIQTPEEFIGAPQPEIIPDGFHRMPDGSIMADSDMNKITLPTIEIPTIEIIPPVAFGEEIEKNYSVNVYNIRDNGDVFATSYLNISGAKLEELSKSFFVLSVDVDRLPTNKEVQDFYGFTAPVSEFEKTNDNKIDSTMVSQSIGSFILKDGRVNGEILFIANQSFNPFYYGKNLTSLVQIKSKSGVVIAIKTNNLNFTENERDERITIQESAGNFKELVIDFFVWDSPLSMQIFSQQKQIQIVDETDVEPVDPFDPKPPVTTCPPGYHKDFSGKCVEDDPQPDIPKDRLIETLKGFLFGTVALSLLARKY